MAVGETGSVRINVEVAEDALGGEVCNIGTVQADTTDPNLGNNSSEDCADIPEQNPPTTPPPTVTLPQTGSDGTQGFVQFGILFVLLGGVLTLAVRRRTPQGQHTV